MEASEAVLKTLADAEKPLKAAEIAEMAGLDKKEVDKAIKVLKTDGKIVSPKMCYYSKA